MLLSWNEIRQRAIAFSKEWTGTKRESAEKQTFWNEFFDVFGIRRRTVATFEEPVRGISGKYGFIDLFWPGRVLVEHKSFGADLDKAESQAFRYIQDLAREGRNDEIPRYVIISDFTWRKAASVSSRFLSRALSGVSSTSNIPAAKKARRKAAAR